MPSKKSRRASRKRQAPKRAKLIRSRKPKKITTRLIISKRVAKPPRIRKAILSHPQKATTRELKNAFKFAKRLGLTKSKRSVTKIQRGDKQSIGILRKLRNVFRGKTTYVRVSKSQRQQFKKAGFRVKNGFVVIPSNQKEKISYAGGSITRTIKLKKGQIKTTVLPIAAKNLHQFLERAKRDKELQGLLPQGAKWGFRIYGNASYQTFSTLTEMIEYLERYKDVRESIANDDVALMDKTLESIEIVEIEDSGIPRFLKRKRRRVNRTGRSK